MPSLLIFTCTDIGQNYRLLRHAKSFATLPNSHVEILAPDITSLPKEIENSPNIIHHYLFAFHSDSFFDQFLFPLRFVLYAIQIFHLFFTSKTQTFDFVISCSWPLIDPIMAKLLAFLFKSKLIIDISLFRFTNIAKSSSLMRYIEKNVTKKADYRICSTRAMQVVLQLRNVSSTIIHDPPGSMFKPYLNIRNEVFSYLNTQKEFLVSAPMPYYDFQQMQILTNLCRNLNEKGGSAAVVIFGSPKAQAEIERQINGANEILSNSDNNKNKPFKNRHQKPNENHQKSDTKNIESDLNDQKSDKTNKGVTLHFAPANTDAYAHILGCSDVAVLLCGTRHGLDISPELTEAVSCGVPVVVGRCGCVSEAFREGEGGLVFGSADELSSLMSKIIVEKEINLSKMRDALKKSKFDWKSEWKVFFDPLLENCE
ncbi:hypothetical protein TRFO_06946 [Tritrichomonas foetus]|uniref:Glycosyl transferase family 1 domain-containing protein n=1 Tax=Tritrichomonas foetus TaxID=1144522 RepID=A0A1J4JV63_9EUKA|nr:hypothetical protein TRFO_06946 [Tritrichomonas foetus]|eukprot:OHT02891.1 hypothetical protein TRFO_06946 [Tritrichomonas foetus]